jgi:tetratricopeptide (TPR) repeat protein
MTKKFTAALILVLLAGCSGNRKSDSDDLGLDNPRAVSGIQTPKDFVLPGVPMKSELPPALAELNKAEVPAAPGEVTKTEAPAEAPAEVKTATAAPAEAVPAPASNKDLEFHLAAAGKYFSRKQYKSAAAEYDAALPFLPAGDARAVRLLERQGAMLLKARKDLKAQEQFEAAIAKAKELNASGEDLANAYLGLGYCQEKAKKAPEAIASYEKAIELTGSKDLKARLAGTINDLKKAP